MRTPLSAHPVFTARRLLPGLALTLALVATGLLSPVLPAAQTPAATLRQRGQ